MAKTDITLIPAGGTDQALIFFELSEVGGLPCYDGMEFSKIYTFLKDHITYINSVH